jgi:phenylacetaldehyde dehydrogenase
MKTIISQRRSARHTLRHHRGLGHFRAVHSERAATRGSGGDNGHTGTRPAGPAIRPELRTWLTRAKHNLIGGKWVSAASGKTFDVFNPADASVIARVPDSEREDINRAVTAARRASGSDPWRRMPPSDRGKLIWRIGDLILQHADELAELESLDNGKPRAVARVADVPLAADLFHYMAGWATKKWTK